MIFETTSEMAPKQKLQCQPAKGMCTVGQRGLGSCRSEFTRKPGLSICRDGEDMKRKISCLLGKDLTLRGATDYHCKRETGVP